MASSSSSSSPCAGCKFLRRKCTPDCVFAPYFPPDNPQKFANVHKIFGASNVTKILNDLPVDKRDDAVNSLSYEADARVKDPVYGCVGTISVLMRQVQQLQQELVLARQELARSMTTSVGVGAHQALPSPLLSIGMGQPSGSSRDQHMLTVTREQMLQDYARQEVAQFERQQLLDIATPRRSNTHEGSYENLAATGFTGSDIGAFPSRKDGSAGTTEGATAAGGGQSFSPP